MINALKENDLETFKTISSDFCWVEIPQEKMKELEQELQESERKESKRLFAKQRVAAVVNMIYCLYFDFNQH